MATLDGRGAHVFQGVCRIVYTLSVEFFDRHLNIPSMS